MAAVGSATGTAAGLAAGAGFGGPGSFGRLTPHHVSLCTLLVQYAQETAQGAAAPALGPAERAARQRFFELLFQAARAAQHGPKTLQELECELCGPGDRRGDGGGAVLWAALLSHLRSIASPDALFDTFHSLEAAVSRGLGPASPLCASGLFGQLARRCLLAFKACSFEAVVKLYDATRDYIAEFDRIEQGRGVAVAHAHVLTAPVSPFQVGQVAHALLRELPLGFGRLPWPAVDRALGVLQEHLPQCHAVHLLRYLNSLQHRLADEAGLCLRAFHDGSQRVGPLAEAQFAAGIQLGALPPEDGVPDLIQHASLALAGLHSEMGQADDALQAVGESIRAAQEASDGDCLCACLYVLSLVLLQAGWTSKAFGMLRRCLHRSEALGLPALQSLCCLGIARALSMQPGLSDRCQRGGSLWREPSSRVVVEPSHGGAAMLRAQGSNAGGGSGGSGVFAVGGGPTGGSSGGGSASNAQRSFGFFGGGGRGGLNLLAALLQQDGHKTGVGAGAAPSYGVGAACRDAFAHTTLASQLSVQAGCLADARAKVLLSQAEVARLFGLQPLAAASCALVLDVYSRELGAEDWALALCQLASATAEESVTSATPLLQNLVRQLPHASHLWAHVVGPRLIATLLSAGECAAASALLFQVAGVIRAVPHGAAASSSQRFRAAANAFRLYNYHLLAAHRSAREAVEGARRTGAPGDICLDLLCLADVHLAAMDPIRALGPCLRCLSAAEASRLLQFRAEALVRLARVRLEMRDLMGALQLAEEVTPQISAGGSARLRGQALVVQADVLLALLAETRRTGDSAQAPRLLQEVATVLAGAVTAFEAAVEINELKNCHYVLARVQHELGDVTSRDKHATRFRRVSEFLSGGLNRPADATDGERAVEWLALDLPRQALGAGFGVGAAGAATGRVPSTQTALPTGAVELPQMTAQTSAAADQYQAFRAKTSSDASEAREESKANANEVPGGRLGRLAPHCPVLDQLLAFAEAAHLGRVDGAIGIPETQPRTEASGATSSFFGAVPREGFAVRTEGVAAQGTGPLDAVVGVPAVIGSARALYPMAAALGV